MRMATVVECEIDMDLIVGMDLIIGVDRTLPVTAHFSYSSGYPYQVVATFRHGEEKIATWVFCRRLLLEGAFRRAGQGDVRIWPDHARSLVCIGLSAPGGSSLLLAPAEAVFRWNDRMCRVVPPGTESDHVDLDREVAALLGG
ncbi:hypothetical protein AQ490_24120 [Wenjunlia vitaminophila]|uniref:Uncharacterized protein n=1 Tax=Wenjunlia vitaminophila TaxID=76728 RepID=A0A0T6LR86_WENVI|nr:SsgA family sporulation/cell division regulator [Wenjunlia vitaminophila]KRV48627.1 hypothetical protein AQ490_24120 [Wenjunlia vitaminophila]